MTEINRKARAPGIDADLLTNDVHIDTLYGYNLKDGWL